MRTTEDLQTALTSHEGRRRLITYQPNEAKDLPLSAKKSPPYLSLRSSRLLLGVAEVTPRHREYLPVCCKSNSLFLSAELYLQPVRPADCNQLKDPSTSTGPSLLRHSSASKDLYQYLRRLAVHVVIFGTQNTRRPTTTFIRPAPAKHNHRKKISADLSETKPIRLASSTRRWISPPPPRV